MSNHIAAWACVICTQINKVHGYELSQKLFGAVAVFFLVLGLIETLAEYRSKERKQ